MANFPMLGELTTASGFRSLSQSRDGVSGVGKNGLLHLYSTADNAVEFQGYQDHTTAFVRSSIGPGAYYPILPISLQKPIKYVLMDLDGTSVKSESFWIWIIEMTMQSVLGDRTFHLAKVDEPNVSGHSVSEHLQYCIDKYAPGYPLAQAREFYFEHTHREMALIAKGEGKKDAFTPSEGLKSFLLALKNRGIKIGLVTSGLYEKAWPEIYGAFQSLGLGNPADFYDCIISAGTQLKKGQVGTLGELTPKPHPWLYAETAYVGLGVKESERSQCLGIEDSGAGICSIRLAGFTAIGIAGGNIVSSGTKELCSYYGSSLKDIGDFIL